MTRLLKTRHRCRRFPPRCQLKVKFRCCIVSIFWMDQLVWYAIDRDAMYVVGHK